MLTLTEFLSARIAEDEAVARAATTAPWGHDPSKEWHTDPAMLARAREGRLTYGGEEFVRTDSGACVAATGPADDAQSMADAAHIARHDPARVLAECEAKRRIVEEHAPVDYGSLGMTSPNACRLCGVDLGMSDWEYVRDSFPCPTLRHLAAVYADHDDYDESWRP